MIVGYPIKKIFFLLALGALSLNANPTQDLIIAIGQGNYAGVQQALTEGADINFHGTCSFHDLAATDWTPLMKSIAKLNSEIITAQTLINTVTPLVHYSSCAITAIGWGISAIKRSMYPGLIATASQIMFILALKPALKTVHKNTINDQYAITNLLLNHPNNVTKNYCGRNGQSATSLCQRGIHLLRSKDLCPPYTARTPEREYTDMLTNIQTQLPTPNRQQAPEHHDYFTQDITFKTINPTEKLPIIFHPLYDITFGGLERLHPFDTKKYGKIAACLKEKLDLSNDQFYTPESISTNDLLIVHEQKYLDSLNSSFKLGLIADMPFLAVLPRSVAQKALLEPVKLASGGTILGAQLALTYGWAINLSGGYHHAKSAEPVIGGFCILNDICVAAKKILIEHPDYRILIIDLDAHQGNGHEEMAKNEPNIAIFDVYNGDTWPGDFTCEERINFNYPLKSKTKNGDYLSLLISELPKALDAIKPNLIIYNAGTDIYEKDPIGVLSLTKSGIIARDEIVFTEAINRNIPILMVLSGGYHTDSYSIISDSIVNMWNKKLLHATCE